MPEAVAPGATQLPATLSNFDAIMAEQDGAPSQGGGDDDGFDLPPQPSTWNKPRQSQQEPPKKPAQAKPEPQAEPELEPELEFDDEGNPIEPELDAETQTPDDFELAVKAKDWLESPELPEEFLTKTGVAKVDGEEHTITVKEAFEGYQRRAITTQRQQEAAQVKGYYNNLIQAHRQRDERWKDPAVLRTELQDMGYDTHTLAQLEFQEYAQDQRTLDAIQDPQAKAYAAQRLKAAREAEARARRGDRALEQAQQNAGQNRQQQEYQAVVQRTSRQLAQLAPKAFKEVGLKVTPYTKSLLGNELRQIHQFGTDLSYDLVIEALKTAKDVYDAKQEEALMRHVQGRVRSKALPPRRASPNPSPIAPRGNPRNAPARVSDFDKIMREQDGGGR